MTTVLACARDGLVHMAADTMTNVYDRPIYGAVEKTLRVPAGDGAVLLGFAGSGALLAGCRTHLNIDDVPAAGEDPTIWANTVAAAVSDIAVEARALDEDGRIEATVLLGWDGRLWTIATGWAIPHRDGLAAAGSGEGPAMGALTALLEHGVAARHAVVQAVRIAARYDRHSSEPVSCQDLPAHPRLPAALTRSRKAAVATRATKAPKRKEKRRGE